MIEKCFKVFLISLVFFSSVLIAQSFEEYLQQSKSGYDKYKSDIDKEFEEYQKVYQEAFNEYISEIEKKWPKPEVTTKHKWVEYSDDYNDKKSIDYENENITVEVIADNEKEAKEKIGKIFDEMAKYSVEDSLKKDILENKIAKKLSQPLEKKLPLDQKILSDVISQKEQEKIKEKLLSKKIVQEKYNGKFIYKANVKLPPEFIIKKAKTYQNIVHLQSRKVNIPSEVIYAIMHSESSFNPMARSHVPAFGLMQIVPKTAGVDTYFHLYGKKKVLSSQYLYDANNNILIGSNYLHILYFKYLKGIQDPQSRLYCAIAAYNTGAGNVSKAFIGNTNIKKASLEINKMSSEEVYKKLLRDLPYNETKKYLVKVNERISSYKILMEDKKL